MEGKVRKCGEVFIDEDDLFSFICLFCKAPFQEVDNFFLHIKGDHEQKYELNKQQKDDENESHDGNFEEQQDEKSFHIPEIEMKNRSYGIELNDSSEISEDDVKGEQSENDEFDNECLSDWIHKTKENSNEKNDETERNEKNKMSGRTEDKLECLVYGKFFPNVEHLRTHNKKGRYMKKTTKSSLKCGLCEKEFGTPRNFESHIKISKYCQNRNDIEIKVNPKDLLYDTESKGSLENLNEEKLEDENKSEKYFEDKISEKRKNELECSVCGKCFVNEARFKIHKERVKCIAQSNLKCDRCGKHFGLHRNYKRHVLWSKRCRDPKWVSDPIIKKKSFKCKYCDELFPPFNNMLEEHERTHTGERPFQCHICGKQFRTQLLCENHEKLHNGKRSFKCNICNLEFRSPGNLHSHKQRHGEKKFSCGFCEKSFFRKSEKISHERIHTGDKPYKCKFCEKCFRTSTNMIYHRKTHLSTNFS